MNLFDSHEGAVAKVLSTRQFVHQWTDEALRTTESPIEARFCVAFKVAAAYLALAGYARFALQLRPQVWVEAPSGARYRLDFALEPQDQWLADALVAHGLELKVGVELDGHEFHERTPEQVVRRDRRDAELIALGWWVRHVSGWEAQRHLYETAVEVLQRGADALDKAKQALVGF
jgi:hypothetical protein